MNTAYKGFTITETSAGLFEVVIENVVKKYKTINTAKGAITKHIAAASVINVEKPADGAVKLHDMDGETASAITAVESLTVNGFTRARNANGDPIHADPAMAKVYASLDYYGMTKNRDTRSRNKREGNYAGKFSKHHYRSHRAAMPGKDMYGRTAKDFA
jgi:hypothetical protein